MPVPNGLGWKPTHCYSLTRVVAATSRKEKAVSRFRKLSQSIWHCQYHIVGVPKNRYRVLDGPVRDAAYKGIHSIWGYSGSEGVEMNIQKDHVHLVVMVPPKIAISDVMGRLKGQTAIKTFKQFPHLRKKPYWGGAISIGGRAPLTSWYYINWCRK